MKARLDLILFVSYLQLFAGYKVTIINDDNDLKLGCKINLLAYAGFCENKDEDLWIFVDPKSNKSEEAPKHVFNCCIKEIIISARERISAPRPLTIFELSRLKGEEQIKKVKERSKAQKDFYEIHPLPGKFSYKPKNGCADVTLQVKEVNGKLVVTD